MIWPFGGDGGLPGTLAFLGLAGLVGLVTLVFTIAIVMMLMVAVIEARGTYHVREHVTDMLPGAVAFILIVIIASHV